MFARNGHGSCFFTWLWSLFNYRPILLYGNQAQIQKQALILCSVFRIMEFAVWARRQSLCDPESAMARPDLLPRARNITTRLHLHGGWHQKPGSAFHDVEIKVTSWLILINQHFIHVMSFFFFFVNLLKIYIEIYYILWKSVKTGLSDEFFIPLFTHTYSFTPTHRGADSVTGNQILFGSLMEVSHKHRICKSKWGDSKGMLTKEKNIFPGKLYIKFSSKQVLFYLHVNKQPVEHQTQHDKQ